MIHILDLNFLGNQETIAAFLIVNSQNEPILIETGPYSTFPVLEKAVQKHGFHISDIKHVLVTHIHLDHAGAAWALAQQGATIYLHPFGANHLGNPEKLMASAKMIYKENMERLWGDMKKIPTAQLCIVEHEQELTFGDVKITAWHTPGHANHHIAWQYGKALFTGDVAGVRIGKGLVIPPCPPPDISIQKWQKSIQIIKEINPETIYLTHFGKFSGDIHQHLEELENRLLKYADWVKERWQKGESQEQMVIDFEKYSQQELVDFGLNGEALQQYSAANPAWMCIAGLVRYWKKEMNN